MFQKKGGRRHKIESPMAAVMVPFSHPWLTYETQAICSAGSRCLFLLLHRRRLSSWLLFSLTEMSIFDHQLWPWFFLAVPWHDRGPRCGLFGQSSRPLAADGAAWYLNNFGKSPNGQDEFQENTNMFVPVACGIFFFILARHFMMIFAWRCSKLAKTKSRPWTLTGNWAVGFVTGIETRIEPQKYFQGELWFACRNLLWSLCGRCDWKRSPHVFFLVNICKYNSLGHCVQAMILPNVAVIAAGIMANARPPKKLSHQLLSLTWSSWHLQ